MMRLRMIIAVFAVGSSVVLTTGGQWVVWRAESGSGTGSADLLRAETLSPGTFRARVSYERVDFGTRYAGTQSAGNPLGEELSIDRLALGFTFQLFEALRLDATIPLLDIRAEVRANGVRRFGSGLGDVQVLGTWRAFDDVFWSHDSLAFSAGVSLPTGDAEQVVPSGAIPQVAARLGTGTADPLFGVSYAHRENLLSLYASFFTRLSVEENRFSYKTGTSQTGRVGVAYDFAFLALQLDHRLRDRFAGAGVDNSGSTALALVPGVIVRPWDRMALEFSVQVPVWRNLNGTQLAPGPAFLISVSFDVIPGEHSTGWEVTIEGLRRVE